VNLKLIGRRLARISPATPVALNPGPFYFDILGSVIEWTEILVLVQKRAEAQPTTTPQGPKKKPRDHPPTTTEQPQQTLPESRKPGINK
jgi:hypothetical protein